MNEYTPQIPVVTDEGPDVRPRISDRRLRRAIGAVAIIILVLVAALAGVAGGDRVTPAEASDPASASSSGDDGPTSDDAAVTDDDETSLDETDDSTGYGDAGGNVAEPPVEPVDDGPVELEPVETVDQQCGAVLASGASLLVTPDPAQLEPGDMSDSLTIRNCGDHDVDWTAKTVPDVALDTAASTLAGGQTTQLGFTIDSAAFEPGAIDFKIKVSEPGHNSYVDVHAFRKTVGKDMVASNELSAGAQAGGCANSCITKAWLTPNASTPNLSFEVETNTPATIRVWVATDAPTGNGQPMASSPAGSIQWDTVLEPLQADTEYHLLLRATDGNGKTDERTTTFKTVKPVNTVGGYAAVDPKCHAQCISAALVSSTGDFATARLDVDATTPARFQAWLSTAVPVDHDGKPTFDDPDLVVVSGLEYRDAWSVDLTPLEGSTTYHVIVLAEDVGGETAHRVGSFTTAAEPTADVLISFHRLTVTHDGDSSWKNRGELSFSWSVGDTFVGSRAEAKMSDGDGFSFNRSKASYLATGLRSDDFLPGVRVSGSERDADGKTEFCALGSGTPTQPGSHDDCDAKWNVATSGLVTTASIETMTRCSEFGIAAPTADDGCMLLETPGHGADYARFQVLVSFHVAD